MKILVPFTVYNAVAPSIDRRIMFATNCCLFDNHKGIFSIKDTKVLIKSTRNEQSTNQAENLPGKSHNSHIDHMQQLTHSVIQCLMDTKYNIICNEMGLLQLVVTWYMLEGKLPTGTSKTKRLHQDKFEFSLFWMSQWAACPPARTM